MSVPQLLYGGLAVVHLQQLIQSLFAPGLDIASRLHYSQRLWPQVNKNAVLHHSDYGVRVLGSHEQADYGSVGPAYYVEALVTQFLNAKVLVSAPILQVNTIISW